MVARTRCIACVYLHVHVWSTCTCMKYMYMYEVHVHVWSTCTCMKYMYMYEVHVHVWSTCTCMKYMYMYEVHVVHYGLVEMRCTCSWSAKGLVSKGILLINPSTCVSLKKVLLSFQFAVTPCVYLNYRKVRYRFWWWFEHANPWRPMVLPEPQLRNEFPNIGSPPEP